MKWKSNNTKQHIEEVPVHPSQWLDILMSRFMEYLHPIGTHNLQTLNTPKSKHPTPWCNKGDLQHGEESLIENLKVWSRGFGDGETFPRLPTPMEWFGG